MLNAHVIEVERKSLLSLVKFIGFASILIFMISTAAPLSAGGNSHGPGPQHGSP